MARPFRIGLLGASKIAPTAVITPARDNPDFAITVVAARNADRARAYAAEHGIPGVAADYAALVAHPDVDVVYNALPPVGHLPWTLAALKAGKAVLCEKPFAMNAGESRTMVDAAKAAGLPLLEAAHYRFHSVMRRAEAMMREGVLGKVVSAEAEFSVPIPRTPDELRWRADLGGGGLMDLGFYPIHALRTLMGAEPVVISAHGTFEDGIDSSMSARLRFGETPATVACAMAPPAPSARLAVQGERGLLEILNFVAPQQGCRFTTVIDGLETRHNVTGPTTYEAQLINLAQVLRGETAPVTGGEDAVANMAVIDAIYAAAGRPSI
ncbi:MAG TPA: Gfo/Idh/MocA family oxidoreductase [Caulobacteraceae bacterium]